MILEFDLGNTRGKWRIVKDGVVVERGSLDHSRLGTGQEVPAIWRTPELQRVRAANVAGGEVAAALEREFASSGLAIEYARVEPLWSGVSCAYRDVSRLGVDRWLAVLAVHARDVAPALVVDAGSAVTLDLLGSGGQHLGGYIVPGLGLMRRALYRDTDAVKVAEPAEAISLAPGRHTDEAVNHGLPLMVLGAIEMALAQLVAAEDKSGRAGIPKVWFTGGDAPTLSALYGGVQEHVPELVLDGLAISNP